jgi:hypothetical protein
MKALRCVLLVGIVVAAVVRTTPDAIAGCHAFTISVSPTTVDEGETVTVTVSRDGNAGPSRVHVRTVAGSAHAPQDYDGLVKRPVVFTTETSKSFTLATRDDTVTEPNETFSLKLFDGDGCPPNPRFRYGPDAVVTIAANDSEEQPATASPAPAEVTEAPTASPVATATPEPVGEGMSTGAVVGIVAGAVVALAAIVAAFVFGRRRGRGSAGP